MNETLQSLTRAIEKATSIAVIFHVSPDGDACGSALALRRALFLLGKQAEAVCDDPVPHIYRDLEGAALVKTPEAVGDRAFDLAIAVDVGDRGRLGRSAQVFDAAGVTAQLDHHGTNPGYAALNYLRTPLSATGVLVLELIDALGVSLDLPMAACLYVAVATDTGNFKQQNTDAEALRLAARCVQAGLSPEAITRRVFDLRPLCQVKLMGRAFLSMETHRDGRIAVMALSKRDFEETGALPEHTEGIINFGINTEGVRIACLLSELPGQVKCSLRALAPQDVARVAAAFGGGGHALAAGCVLNGSLAEAVSAVRDAMAQEMERTP